jgi:cysteinyl-tRNA synthetase
VSLRVYNTRTKSKDPFVPAHPKVVRIYTCGLTVYSAMHIGHARTYCFWDTFRRWLEYRGFHVVSVINYTDIDDRIMQKADADPTIGCLDVAEEVIASFRRDCRSLHIKDYAAYTRATDFVEEQVESVKRLIEAGHGYVVDGEVLYDVQSFERYGQLSGNTLDGQQAGASGRLGDEARRKRHPADFTLWKPSEEGQPTWATGEAEWPSGRPGWHIECSAMSSALLGDTFDVHGGAVDNLFPHHENEVAQSEPLCGHPWVRYWMHPEHLDLRGEKMSKSLGNVIGIPELVETHGVEGVRWFFNSTHYRTKLSFSGELVASNTAGFEKVLKLLSVLEARLEGADDDELRICMVGNYASLRSPTLAVPREREAFSYGEFGAINLAFVDRFIEAMDDDMGTPQAVAAVFDYVNQLYAAGVETGGDTASALAAYRCLARHLYVLGVERPHPRLYPQLTVDCFPKAVDEGVVAPYAAVIDKLLVARADARKAKDFAKADLIRDLLAEAGVEVEDTPAGSRWSV